MKALSIVAPNGMKIATGEKTIEVRRWAPDLSVQDDLLIVENDRFLYKDGKEDLDGKAVAVVRVLKVRPFTMNDMTAACASRFVDGWLAWELADIRPIKCSKQVLAARGIYELSDDFLSLC